MTRKSAWHTLGVLGLMTHAALAITSGDLPLARSFDKTLALPNSPIVVTATFTNASTNALRGFYYFEQMPSGLAVATVGVTSGGRTITNFIVESGQDGDVYAGCTPWRWRLETPTNFVEANPVPPQGVVQIVFSISCASTGTFNLQQFGCATCAADKTNAFFGSSAPTNAQTVSFVVVVNESNAPPVLPAQPDRVIVGQQALVVTNTASDADIPANSLTYQLVAGPLGAAIDTNGIITWTPALSQVASTNLLTTVVTDFNPWAINAQHLSATNSFRVVVNAIHNGPILPAQANLTITELTTLTLTNAAIDADIPPLGLTYGLVNPPAGAGIDTNGVISWTPSKAQGPGTNTLTTVVTDNGVPSLSATNSFVVVVNESNTPPVLPAQPDRVIVGQQALVVTNTASDADLPANGLTYQLVEGPAGAAIDTYGVLTWKPALWQVPSTNLLTTVVTDFNPWAVNAQHLSATNSLSVVVLRVPSFRAVSVAVSDRVATITWESVPGQTYRLQYKNNLNETSWQQAQADILATGPTASTTNVLDSGPSRLYRVMLVP